MVSSQTNFVLTPYLLTRYNESMNRKAGIHRTIARKNGGLHVPDRARKLVDIGGQSNGRGTGGVATNDGRFQRVLSEEEVVETIGTCQKYMLSLLPKAITAYAAALDADDPRTKLTAATKLLEGVGLFRRGGIEQVLETTAAANEKRGEQRLVTAGLFMRHTLDMAEIYKMPLPSGLAEQAREFADKVEELTRMVGTEADSKEEDALFKCGLRLTPSSSPKQTRS